MYSIHYKIDCYKKYSKKHCNFNNCHNFYYDYNKYFSNVNSENDLVKSDRIELNDNISKAENNICKYNPSRYC